MLRVFSLFCLIFVISISGFKLIAGGYQVNLQGVKQTGMGHCGVSLYQGASSLFFNPASLSLSKNKFSFSGGFNLVDGRVVHYNATTNAEFRNDRKFGTPLGVYFAYNPTEKIGIGVGVYTPFGSSLNWEENWAGRFVNTHISLRTVYIQPTLSYRLGKVSFGAGIMLGSGSLVYGRDIPVRFENGETGNVILEADAKSIGVNLGFWWGISPKLSFGASYRSEHKYMTDDGFADFTVPESASDQLYDQAFSSQINAPSNLMVGLSYHPAPKWTISAEVNFTGWSVYKELEIDFRENTDVLRDVVENRNWKDSEAYRFGVEFKANRHLDLRLGYSRDLSPVNNQFYGPETPDSDRTGYHAGASINIGKKLSLDLAFQLAEADQIEAVHSPSGFGGMYKARAFVYAGGLSYNF